MSSPGCTLPSSPEVEGGLSTCGGSCCWSSFFNSWSFWGSTGGGEEGRGAEDEDEDEEGVEVEVVVDVDEDAAESSCLG